VQHAPVSCHNGGRQAVPPTFHLVTIVCRPESALHLDPWVVRITLGVRLAPAKRWALREWRLCARWCSGWLPATPDGGIARSEGGWPAAMPPGAAMRLPPLGPAAAPRLRAV